MNDPSSEPNKTANAARAERHTSRQQTPGPVKVEEVVEHHESENGRTQDVVVVGVTGTQSDSTLGGTSTIIRVEDTLTEQEEQSTTVAHLMQSMMLPSRIMMSALRIPFKVAMHGKRRPTWTMEMEMAVSAFRSACRNAPRDLSLLRTLLDIEVFPSLLLPSTVRLHETSLQGMRLEWIFPSSLPNGKERLTNDQIVEWSNICPIVLYLHGGGHALCGTNTHRMMVAQFATEGLIVCAPNYRRPPEVSIIDAVDDCLATYRYLVDIMGIDPQRVAIMGDSAGGALTVLLMCRIRDENEKAGSVKIKFPSCGVLLSPWVELEDATIVAEAAKGNVMPQHDYLPRDALIMISRLVVGKLKADDPRINPISARLSGLPRLLIHVGELELLFDQITRFYEKVRDEGGEVRMKIWIDGVHVPHVFTPVSEEARVAVNDAANFIKQYTHGLG